MEPIIRVDRASMAYRTRKGITEALRNLSLDIHAHEILCIVGSSGCGKSTLLNLIAGFVQPTRGTIYLKGQRVTGVEQDVASVATTDELARLQRECRMGYVDPSLIQYAVRLVAATRNPERFGIKDMARYLTYGASPRATIHLIEGARALAFLRGRAYALPEDVSDLAPDVLRHRLSLSYEALSDALTADALIARIMQHVRRPEKPLDTHVRIDAKPKSNA